MIAAERRSAGPADVTRDGTFRPPLRVAIAEAQLAEFCRRDRVFAAIRAQVPRRDFKRLSGLDPDRLAAGFWERIEFWTNVVWDWVAE